MNQEMNSEEAGSQRESEERKQKKNKELIDIYELGSEDSSQLSNYNASNSN